MGENHFPLKIIFLFFFAKQRKMKKSFSTKIIFTPTKHTLSKPNIVQQNFIHKYKLIVMRKKLMSNRLKSLAIFT